jgi:hypothetical protein
MLLCMILKVIGLVLLFLLLLLLLFLGLVLLVPIRYAGAGHKGEEATDYAAHIELSWLLHMVQLHAGITPAGLVYYFRILWFRPIDSRPSDTPPANVSDEASSRSEETEVDSIELKSSTEPAVLTEEKLTSEDVPGSDETEDTSADVDQESKTKSTATTAEALKKKKRKKFLFADRIKRICEKASSLRETVEDEENQKAVRLLLSRVKYLLHHLRFRKFEGRLAFGFEDPAMVGRMLAVLSLFYPLYGECFTITPVFDHTLFEGEIALKGHVRLIHILIAVIQLMMNKKIRGLVLDRI